MYACESSEVCDHEIPDEVYDTLGVWRNQNDWHDDLYLVHVECVEGHEVVEKRGDYCVIRDSGR